MKKRALLPLSLLSGLLAALTACSKSDSPTAPKPSPTPQAVSVSLSVSASSASVGEAVEARATVRQGTAAVPDGTVVNFTLPRQVCGERPCHYFIENSDVTLAKATQGGVASAAWTSVTAGDVTVSASVGSASDSKTVRFTSPQQTVPPQAAPRFYSITPSSGSARGGFNATISGQWLCKAYSTNGCVTPADVSIEANFRYFVGIRVILRENDIILEEIYEELQRTVSLRVISFTGTGVSDSLVVAIPEVYPEFIVDDPVIAALSLSNGVGGVTKVAAAFSYQPDLRRGGPPKIFELIPSQGSWRGGEVVTITGEDLCVVYRTATGQCETRYLPAVLFTPGSNAEVLSVSPDGRSIKVRTPSVQTVPPTTEILSNVRVVTGSNRRVELLNAFLYLPDVIRVSTPVILSVVPNQGSWQGGEEVEIRGQNLCVYRVVATGLCTSDAPAVSFTLGAPVGATYPAQVVHVSPDGRALRVKTPRAGVAPPTEDVYADITVTNQSGGTMGSRVFVYPSSGQPAVTPVLYALSPNAGPIEGGTRVTIWGSGFQYPVQVLFGDREAQVVSSNFNEIVCIAPSIAPSNPQITPVSVDVHVINVLTGKRSALPLRYRYGEAMFVSAITPSSGYILGWTPATIYGQGFVAPVRVILTFTSIISGARIEAEVISVSGTSIQVRIPPATPHVDAAVLCTQFTGIIMNVEVVNVGSNLRVTGPPFTYLCSGGISGP